MSEASVYRILKAHNLITNPAHVVLKAADEIDQIEVWHVQRQVKQIVPDIFDKFENTSDLVGRQVIHDYRVAGGQFLNQ